MSSVTRLLVSGRDLQSDPYANGGLLAIVWFLISDRIKLLAYRILDPKHKTGRSGGCGLPATGGGIAPDVGGAAGRHPRYMPFVNAARR